MVKAFAVAALWATSHAAVGLTSSTSMSKEIGGPVSTAVSVETGAPSVVDVDPPPDGQIMTVLIEGRAAAVARRGGYARHGRGGYAHRGGVAVGARGGYAHRGGVAVGPRGGVAYRGAVAVGPRGNVAYRGRAVVVRNPVMVGGVYRPYGATWRPGGAIVAGAAVGFVTATAAASCAGAPPQPGYCWYYTDHSKAKGFWDVCP
jgi:hypothetical protein